MYTDQKGHQCGWNRATKKEGKETGWEPGKEQVTYGLVLLRLMQ